MKRSPRPPTLLYYHTDTLFVNAISIKIYKFYLLYGKLLYKLYKFPSCKRGVPMVYYRQKEKGVESNDLNRIQILKVYKF